MLLPSLVMKQLDGTHPNITMPPLPPPRPFFFLPTDLVVSSYFVVIRLLSCSAEFQYCLKGLEGLWCYSGLQEHHPYILACSYGVINEKNVHDLVGITGKRKCQ